MSEFIVTITPTDNPGATTTVRIDANGNGPRVTGLTVDGEFAAHRIPDTAKLLEAIGPTLTPAPASEPEPAPAIPAVVAPVKAAKKTAKTAVKKATPKKTVAPAPKAEGRTYRTRPETFAGDYKVHGGSVAALWAEYKQDDPDLPRHTVQGWVTTFKKQQDAKPAAKSARKSTTARVPAADPKTPFTLDSSVSAPTDDVK